MIEVKIAGIQISLRSQYRVVLLKEIDGERYLPIWIGPFEAEAINLELQQIKPARPLTHDLLKRVIEALGGIIQYVLVSAIENDTFYARIFIEVDGHEIEIDARPSDSMALAVRAKVPIYVDERVMDEVGILPERDLGEREGESAFDEFLSGLDLDDLPIQ